MPIPGNVKQRIAGILAEKAKSSGTMPTPGSPYANVLHPNLGAPPVANSLALPKATPMTPPVYQQGANMLNQGKFFNIKKKLGMGKF